MTACSGSGDAGSVVLFSEAVMHGTAPWRADHERRTLLYKYCVSHMAWSRARAGSIDRLGETTARQETRPRGGPADLLLDGV